LHTYFLGREEVAAYANDLCWRLAALRGSFPCTWCTLGHSGEELALVISEALPKKLRSSIRIIRMHYDRDKRTVSFEDPRDERALAKNAAALILDSSVHSRITMLASFQKLRSLEVRNICTYSLVLKRGSCFIPNFFGVVIEEPDRAYFLLDKIPNLRVMPFGAFRKLIHDDIKRRRQGINSGLKSLDKVTWSDLLYESKTNGNNVFVYEEDDELLGFISFRINNSHLFIDAIAIDKSAQRRGLGGHMMRWAETSARVANCNSIGLWAKNDRVDFYKTKAGFNLTSEELDLGSEKYTRMERPLLYNLAESD
jgi:GNAT superfamily N-acetyltransferase